MRPERAASQEEIRRSEEPIKYGKQALSLGGSLAGGATIASTVTPFLRKISPLLNKLIPTNLAVKGLSKIDSKFKKYFENLSEENLTAEDGLNYFREEIGQKEQIDPLEQQRRESLKKFNEKARKPNVVQQEQERFQKQYGQKIPQQEDEGISQGQALLLAALERNAKLRQQMGG